jgi:hypothetical protein
MTNTQAVEPTPRKQISIPVPSLKLGKVTSLVAVALTAAALTAAAFLVWGPHNPILPGGQSYKVPGGTLSITHDDSKGTFTPFTNPQYVYSTVSPAGTVRCLSDKGYAGMPAAFGMTGTIMIVDYPDFTACS